MPPTLVLRVNLTTNLPPLEEPEEPEETPTGVPPATEAVEVPDTVPIQTAVPEGPEVEATGPQGHLETAVLAETPMKETEVPVERPEHLVMMQHPETMETVEHPPLRHPQMKVLRGP